MSATDLLARSYGLTPYNGGYVNPRGLFIAQRPGAPWLWDVWVSSEAHTALHSEPDAVLAEGLRSLPDAVTAVEVS